MDKWTGPFYVVEKKSEVTYAIAKTMTDPKMKVVHINRLRRAEFAELERRPVFHSTLSGTERKLTPIIFHDERNIDYGWPHRYHQQADNTTGKDTSGALVVAHGTRWDSLQNRIAGACRASGNDTPILQVATGVSGSNAGQVAQLPGGARTGLRGPADPEAGRASNLNPPSKWKTGVVRRLENQLQNHRDDVLAVMRAADMANFLQRFERNSIRRRTMFWLNLADTNTIYQIQDIQTWVACAKARVICASMMAAADGYNQEMRAQDQQEGRQEPGQRMYSRFSRSEGDVVIVPTNQGMLGAAKRVSRKVRAQVLVLERVRNMHGGPYHPKPEQTTIQTTTSTQTGTEEMEMADMETNSEQERVSQREPNMETVKGKGKGKASARTKRQTMRQATTTTTEEPVPGTSAGVKQERTMATESSVRELQVDMRATTAQRVQMKSRKRRLMVPCLKIKLNEKQIKVRRCHTEQVEILLDSSPEQDQSAEGSQRVSSSDHEQDEAAWQQLEQLSLPD